MNGASSRGSEPSSQNGQAPDRGLVSVLSALLHGLLTGLYAGVAILLISYLGYLYLKSPAGAWASVLTGLGHETWVVLACLWLALMKLGVLGLGLLCLIVWSWRRALERTLAGPSQGRDEAGR